MKRIELGQLYYEISRHNPPRVSIDPGETVIVETEDAFSGQIRTESDRRDRTTVPYSNPQTGPILVNGAKPGDTLSVRIEDIEPLRGQAATRTGAPGGLGECWDSTFRTARASVRSEMARCGGARSWAFRTHL